MTNKVISTHNLTRKLLSKCSFITSFVLAIIASSSLSGCQSTNKPTDLENNHVPVVNRSNIINTVSNSSISDSVSQSASNSSEMVSSQNTTSVQPSTVAPVQYPKITQFQSLNALNMARRHPDLSMLVESVEASGIAGMLRFAGNDYTIFAPNNAAFEALFRETSLTKQKLLENKPLLRSLLAYHVVKTGNPLLSNQLPPGQLKTYGKKPLTITAQRYLLDGKGRTAHIITPNIVTKNGTVHIIDKVMFPR